MLVRSLPNSDICISSDQQSTKQILHTDNEIIIPGRNRFWIKRNSFQPPAHIFVLFQLDVNIPRRHIFYRTQPSTMIKDKLVLLCFITLICTWQTSHGDLFKTRCEHFSQLFSYISDWIQDWSNAWWYYRLENSRLKNENLEYMVWNLMLHINYFGSAKSILLWLK